MSPIALESTQSSVKGKAPQGRSPGCACRTYVQTLCPPALLTRQVMRDGRGMLGLIDYAARADMETALRKLDDSEFKNPYDT